MEAINETAAAWIDRLHSRAVDTISHAATRETLQAFELQITAVAGWPTFRLVRRCSGDRALFCASALLDAYLQALRSVVTEAAESLELIHLPLPPDADLGELWELCLRHLPLPSTRMLLSQQAALRSLDGGAAVVEVKSTWLAMAQDRQRLVEDAMSQTLGRQITLTLVPDAAEQHRQLEVLP